MNKRCPPDSDTSKHSRFQVSKFARVESRLSGVSEVGIVPSMRETALLITINPSALAGLIEIFLETFTGKFRSSRRSFMLVK